LINLITSKVFKKIMPKRNMDKMELFSSHNQMWNSKWAKEKLDVCLQQHKMPRSVTDTFT